MYTRTERPIPFFCESDEISRRLQAPRYAVWVPVLHSPLYFPVVIKHSQGAGTTELEVERKLETLGSHSTLSIPDIVLFHIRQGSGAAGFDPGRAGNVGCAHSGERIEERLSCDPLDGSRNTINWVSWTHTAQLVASKKRSHLIRPRPAW